MGFLDSLGVSVKGLGKTKKTDQGAVTTMLTANVGSMWDTALESGGGEIDVYTGVQAMIGRYKIPALCKIAFGKGKLGANIQEQGLLFLDTNEAGPSPCTGLYRFYTFNMITGNKRWCGDVHSSEAIAGGATFDRQLARIFTEVDELAQADSYLVLEFVPDAAYTIDQTVTFWQIPATVYPVNH